MNPNVPARLRRASLVSLVAVAAIGSACTGGNLSTLPPAASGLGRNVRIAVQIFQKAPQGFTNDLTAEEKAEFARIGIGLEPNGLRLPASPAVGFYLKIGDTMIPSGANGEFRIAPEINVPAQVELYKQLTDEAPFATVAIRDALQPGTEAPRTVIVPIEVARVVSASTMDGTPTGRAASTKSCCAKSGKTRQADVCERKMFTPVDLSKNDEAVSACEDFQIGQGRIMTGYSVDNDGEDLVDGDTGEGDAKKECALKRLDEFLFTPCFDWTLGRGIASNAACSNERALQGALAPGCFENHKGRFCQNMDKADFSAIADRTTIGVGESVNITVNNNTSSNETMVVFLSKEIGTLDSSVLPATTRIPSRYIEHYETQPLKHVRTRVIKFTAPASLEGNVAEQSVKMNFMGGGKTFTVVVKVVQNCTDSRGRQVPCK